MPKRAIELLGRTLCERGALLGFATIRVRELRRVIHGVGLHVKGESRWAQPPSRPITDGALVHEAAAPASSSRATRFGRLSATPSGRLTKHSNPHDEKPAGASVRGLRRA